MGAISIIFALLMLLGGGQDQADLLDMLVTDNYWQMQNVKVTAEQLERDAGPDQPVAGIDPLLKDLQSDAYATRSAAKAALEQMGPAIIPLLKPATESRDPEVAAVASELVKKFSARGEARKVRRLMAIRTLGERKEEAALPLLRGLTESKEMFVGEYARRSVAQIEGKPYVAADMSKQFMQDMMLLPQDASLVLHAGRLGQRRMTVNGAVESMVDAIKDNPNIAGIMGPGNGKPLDKKETVAKVSDRLLALIERVGNVRLDGATIGFTDNKVGEEEVGWAIVTIRGQYDSKLMFETLRKMPDFEHMKIVPAEKEGDVPMIGEEGGQMAMLFPDDQRMMLVTGPGSKSGKKAVADALEAIRTGKGALANNKDIMDLLKRVDTKLPVWGVSKPTELMQTVKMLEGFVALTLEGKGTKEGVEFTFKGQGNDEQKVKSSVEALNAEIQAALPMIKQEAQQNPILNPVVDMFTSMKAVAQGKEATFTGQINMKVMDVLMLEVGPSFMQMLDTPEQGDVRGGAGVIENVP